MIPAWCHADQAADLPGIYKDVQETTTVNDAIDTGKLYEILLASELYRDVLSQLWNRVNKANPGQLNDTELRMMLGLIALAQTGLKVERLTLEKLATCKSAPIPSFPENVFQPKERSWSFQHESTLESDSTSSPASGDFGHWHSESSTSTAPAQQDDKCSVFPTNIHPTSTGSWSFPGGEPTAAHNVQIPQSTNLPGNLMVGKDRLSASPDYQGFQSAAIGLQVENSDFSDFQGSTHSLHNIDRSSQQPSQSGLSASKLATSLERFTLSNDLPNNPPLQLSTAAMSLDNEFSDFTSFPSVENLSTPATAHEYSNPGNTATCTFPAFPVIAAIPQQTGLGQSTNLHAIPKLKMPDKTHQGKGDEPIGSGATELVQSVPQETIKTADKYDFLRDLKSSNTDDTDIFSLPESSINKVDDFGDFESFEQATPPATDDFEGFQSIRSNMTPHSNQSHGLKVDSFPSTTTSKAFNDTQTFQSVNPSGENAFGNISTDEPTHDDFGDFADFQSLPSPQPTGLANNSVTGIPDSFSLNSIKNPGTNGETKLSSFDQWSHTANSNFTNAVPLDSAQRYKQLCGEEEEEDKHASVWGRCLNSCLLTLATCSLAVQKMTDPSVKQEVLQCKKGMEYFTAITEVFKVTERIQVSLLKTDVVNDKLSGVLMEIHHSWKNISYFLEGSNIESHCCKEDFQDYHIKVDEDTNLACGVCLLNVDKRTTTSTDSKLTHGGWQYHSTCANFWCNRVDSTLPSLLPVNSLI